MAAIPVHATRDELDNWVGESQVLPSNVEQDRLLARASEFIDSVIVVVYAVDEAGVAIDEDQQDALRDATCAQVEFWLDTGDETDATSKWDGAGVGQLRVGKVQRRLAPRAADALHRRGLLGRGVMAL